MKEFQEVHGVSNQNMRCVECGAILHTPSAIACEACEEPPPHCESPHLTRGVPYCGQ